MLWCLAYYMLMSIPTVATGQACSHSVLVVHNILSTVPIDLALILLILVLLSCQDVMHNIMHSHSCC